MKKVFFGLGAMFFLAAFSPSSAEAQFDPCDTCDYSGEWAVCVLGGGGWFEGCHQVSPLGCSADDICWPWWPNQEQQAVDLTGTALDPNTEDKAILTPGTLTRPCDSAITAWALSRAEATQHRRNLRTLVI